MNEEHQEVRVRVAPSPTGVPHVGTAYVTVFNRAFADKNDGSLILRIEDTDRDRSSPEYEEKIFDGLRWLNLDWEEGPDTGGPHEPYRQSERQNLYREHAESLRKTDQAYLCFCSEERLKKLRERQKEQGENIGYDKKCLSLSEEERRERRENGEEYVIRLNVPNHGSTQFEDQIRGRVQVDNRDIDDQILLKSDGYPTYHLANVVDDHHMNISHVMRAEEWIASTHKHILLYDAFGWEPPVFAHLPLLRNKDRSKISKRQNPVSISWYREEGFLPEAFVNFLSLMGFTMPDEREKYEFSELVEELSFDRLRTTAPVFDMEKLEWLNGRYIRDLSDEELADRLLSGGFVDTDRDYLLDIVPLVRERLKRLSDLDRYGSFFFTEELEWTREAFLEKADSIEEVRKILTEMRELLDRDHYTDSDLEDDLRNYAGEEDRGLGSVFMTLRLAITGKSETPPLLESMNVLGREGVLTRVDGCLEFLDQIIGDKEQE